MGIVTRLPLRQAGDSVYLCMMIVISILAALLALYALWERLTGNTYHGLYFGKSKILEKGTAIPFGGNVFMNYWVVKKAQFSSKESQKNDANLLAAFLMKWIQEGRIEVLPDAKLRIGPEGVFDDATEAEFYRAFAQTGGEHLNPGIGSITARAQKHGEELLAAQGSLDKDKHPVPEQYPRMRQVIELRNFLKDIDRADLPWEDYLVTAVLLGCGVPMRSRVPASLSVGLDAVIQMAAYFEEAYRNESMSNWYQSNG